VSATALRLVFFVTAAEKKPGSAFTKNSFKLLKINMLELPIDNVRRYFLFNLIWVRHPCLKNDLKSIASIFVFL
jgi:hypothetical protein